MDGVKVSPMAVVISIVVIIIWIVSHFEGEINKEAIRGLTVPVVTGIVILSIILWIVKRARR